MTIDFEDLAQKMGYDDFRQMVVIEYYLPRSEPSVKEIAKHLGIDEMSLAHAMDRENLPRREKGWRPRREGFYCQMCNCLTPYTEFIYNKSEGGKGAYLCRPCFLKGGFKLFIPKNNPNVSIKKPKTNLMED